MLHRRDLRAFRIVFPSHGGGEARAHLLLPPGHGPHPLVIVFPILAGSHVVSEGLAKALVDRGFATLRLERRALELGTSDDPSLPARTFAESVRDARRLLDWAVTQPSTDPERISAAGVSLGSLLACVLMGVEPRVRSGFFVMSGGGLAEILHDSEEKPVRRFRDRLMAREGLADRQAFLAYMRPFVAEVDPLRVAAAIDPGRVLLISARFDRVMPPARTRALWRALGEPAWRLVPSGHYQIFPFFWWAAARGAEHLARVQSRDARREVGGPSGAAPGGDPLRRMRPRSAS